MFINKIALALPLAFALLTGCYQANDPAQLSQELEKMLTSQNDGDTVQSNPLDKYGVEVTIKKNSLNIKDNPEQVEIFKKTTPEFLVKALCQGTIISNTASKFVNKKNYLKIIYTDKNGTVFSEEVIKNDYCENNKHNNFNATKAFEKQEKQGFYDEAFLKKFYIPLLAKNLPNEIAPNLTIDRVNAGPGSELHFYVVYNPVKEENSQVSIDVLDSYLEQIYDQTCRNPSSKHLISMLDKMKWHGLIHNKEVTNLVASKNCK